MFDTQLLPITFAKSQLLREPTGHKKSRAGGFISRQDGLPHLNALSQLQSSHIKEEELFKIREVTLGNQYKSFSVKNQTFCV